jgi:hypothetical protein
MYNSYCVSRKKYRNMLGLPRFLDLRETAPTEENTGACQSEGVGIRWEQAGDDSSGGLSRFSLYLNMLTLIRSDLHLISSHPDAGTTDATPNKIRLSITSRWDSAATKYRKKFQFYYRLLSFVESLL